MKKIEELLLSCGAVKFNATYPFTYKSGMKSPIYCDAKCVARFPLVYQMIVKAYQKEIHTLWKKAGEPLYLTIVGVEGAVFWATLAASNIVQEYPDMYRGHDDVQGLPVSWVLPAPKDYGLHQRIDGALLGPDNAVVIIENVIKTGGTTLDAVRAVHLAGARDILGIVALMNYDLPNVKEALAGTKVPVITLTTYDKLVSAAVENDYLSKSQVDIVNAWHKNPYNWK